VNFWDAETRIKIPTIAYMRKSVEVEKTTKKIMVDSEILWRRLLAVSNQRDVNIKSLLQHELAAIPPALFHKHVDIRQVGFSNEAGVNNRRSPCFATN
jgi:hypothetical protein